LQRRKNYDDPLKGEWGLLIPMLLKKKAKKCYKSDTLKYISITHGKIDRLLLG
jgi:hypothetical protein